MRYDVSGNIRCKSDVGPESCISSADTHYEYGTGQDGFTGQAGPHAVTEVETAHSVRTFDYDKNGNVTQDYRGSRFPSNRDRTFHYTSYNKLRRVSRAGEHVEFHYGADRSRTLKRELIGSTVQSRTHYIGSVEVVWEGPNPELDEGQYRRYIAGIAIATFFDSTDAQRTRYLHKHHLGSIHAISDANGQVISRQSFDAWGVRRAGEDWSTQWWQWTMGVTPIWAQDGLNETPRGFTGHEHVDDMGIIHMNGRIYDAQLGRFLQADPMVEDSTTLNRYTYVHNNPLAYTDPSGYKGVRQWLQTIASIAITIWLPGALPAVIQASAIATAAITGAVAGFVATGSVEGAFFGALSGAMFAGIGDAFTHFAGKDIAWMQGNALGSGLSGSALAVKSVAHGLAGGVISHAQGGKFGHGFFAAGVTQAASGGIDQIGDLSKFSPERIIAAAVVGGTVSAATGGKFANGAVTGAFSRALNDETHREQLKKSEYAQDHYSRNAENDAYLTEAGLYGRDNITIPEVEMAGDFGFKKSSDAENRYHRNGPGNENNLKFTSKIAAEENWWQRNISNRYGRYEIVLRPNADGITYTHVRDPLNMGTLNRGNNVYTHIRRDVVPYKWLGNTP